jgi:hypothetical protein
MKTSFIRPFISNIFIEIMVIDILINDVELNNFIEYFDRNK